MTSIITFHFWLNYEHYFKGGYTLYSLIRLFVCMFFNWEFKTCVCNFVNGFISFSPHNSTLLISPIYSFMSAGFDKLRSLSRQFFLSKDSHWTGNVFEIFLDYKRLRKNGQVFCCWGKWDLIWQWPQGGKGEKLIGTLLYVKERSNTWVRVSSVGHREGSVRCFL